MCRCFHYLSHYTLDWSEPLKASLLASAKPLVSKDTEIHHQMVSISPKYTRLLSKITFQHFRCAVLLPQALVHISKDQCHVSSSNRTKRARLYQITANSQLVTPLSFETQPFPRATVERYQERISAV